MRYLFYTAVFLFLSPVLVAQKKPFFDKIDITWNAHILNNDVIEKEKWSGLLKEVNLNYPIDSLQYVERFRPKCGMFLPPIYLSGGIRIAKDLFPKSEDRLLENRVEWRSGLLIGSKLQTSTYLTDRNYFQSLPVQVPYRYRDVILTYRRFWIDYSNQVVYKIPSWLFRKNLKYYIGAGIGFTYEANSRVSENYVQNLITQSGNAYIVTQEVNITRNEKAKTVTSTYINVVCGSEIKCSEKVYLLLEANYQGYINSFSLRKRLYKEGGYFSLILRYSF